MASTGDTWRLGRRPALDGLRGVAILLVVLDHGGVGVLNYAGGVGVTLFFVLSGYLITGLLLREFDRSSQISLRDFYVRRARRLLPALLPVLAVTLLVYGAPAVSSTLVSLFYLANIPAAVDGMSLFEPLHHMWSLAVEEQFYLVWPACLLLLLRCIRRPRLAIALTVLAAVGFAVRIESFLVDGYKWAYHATIPNAFPLLSGAALAAAYGLRGRPHGTRATGVVGVLTLLAASAAPLPFGDGPVFARTIAAAVAAVLLIPRNDRWMLFAPLRYCGRISYGWYLWHTIFQFELGGIVGTVVSFALAAVSWHMWESRWARPRPAPSVGGRSSGAGPAFTPARG